MMFRRKNRKDKQGHCGLCIYGKHDACRFRWCRCPEKHDRRRARKIFDHGRGPLA